MEYGNCHKINPEDFCLYSFFEKWSLKTVNWRLTTTLFAKPLPVQLSVFVCSWHFAPKRVIFNLSTHRSALGMIYIKDIISFTLALGNPSEKKYS